MYRSGTAQPELRLAERRNAPIPKLPFSSYPKSLARGSLRTAPSCAHSQCAYSFWSNKTLAVSDILH